MKKRIENSKFELTIQHFCHRWPIPASCSTVVNFRSVRFRQRAPSIKLKTAARTITFQCLQNFYLPNSCSGKVSESVIAVVIVIVVVVVVVVVVVIVVVVIVVVVIVLVVVVVVVVIVVVVIVEVVIVLEVELVVVVEAVVVVLVVIYMFLN